MHEDDVLYFLDADSADPVRVQRCLNNQGYAQWLSVTAVVAGDGEPVRLEHQQVLATEDFRALAQTVRCVVVGAYDGEGHVVWLRDGD